MAAAALSGLLLMGISLGRALPSGPVLAYAYTDRQRRAANIELWELRHELRYPLRFSGTALVPVAWLNSERLLVWREERLSVEAIFTEYAIFDVHGGLHVFDVPQACVRGSVSGKGDYLSCIGAGRRELIVFEVVCVLGGCPLDLRRLALPTTISDYAWSPDGRQIAVALGDVDQQSDWVQIVDLESGASTAIALGDRREPIARALVWSPSGDQLGFVTGANGSYTLRVYHLAQAAYISQIALEGLPRVPMVSWSPDGTRIAFACAGAACIGIHTAQLADGLLDTLTTGLSSVGQPHWSPDGNFIAVNAIPPTGLFLIDLADHAVRALRTRGQPQPSFVWRPCGDRQC
jgi:WD40 repeat protein